MGILVHKVGREVVVAICKDSGITNLATTNGAHALEGAVAIHTVHV